MKTTPDDAGALDPATAEMNARLLAKRARLEAEKAEPKPRTEGTTSGISAEALAKLEALQRRSTEALRVFREWAATQPPPVCRKHGTALVIDEATAAIKIMKGGKPSMVTKACEVCVEEAQSPGVENWLLSIGVPGKLTAATLRGWEATTAEDRVTLGKAREFVEVRRGFFIIASATLGNGKSHLAVAMLRAFGRGRYVPVIELPRLLSARYANNFALDVAEVSAKAPFLVLDDVGVELGRRDSLPALQGIISTRYDDRLPTVITTNFTERALSDYLGPRIEDRLREATFAFRTITGKCRRDSMRKAYFSSPAPKPRGE